MNTNFEKKINYFFKDKKLLSQAMTHSSFSNERNMADNNERLEFLGDAVLELTVSDFLYRKYPHMSEGELTKLRANIVCEPSLAKMARKLELGQYLLFGRGEELTGGRERDSILSDAVEAVIGAMFLDGGMEIAKRLITMLISEDSENIKQKYTTNDYKSHLQELLQKTDNEPIIYDIIHERGPDHDKLFTAQVSHHSKILGIGEGKTKKEAEQCAAFYALEALPS